MKHSDSIAKLAAALVKAHAEVANATKDSTNPAFRSSYASLNSVLDTTKPVLAKHGLCVVQVPAHVSETEAGLESIILHESGEWMAQMSSAPLPTRVTKDGVELPPDSQAVGSAITYLRRYSLAAITGITQEDDDGNAASAPRPAKTAEADDMIDCPACGGPCFDNRTNKRNPRQPDIKCKDRECDNAIWLPSWRDDLIRDLQGLHAIGVIDAAERDRGEGAAKSESPKRMLALAGWIAEKNAGGVNA